MIVAGGSVQDAHITYDAFHDVLKEARRKQLISQRQREVSAGIQDLHKDAKKIDKLSIRKMMMKKIADKFASAGEDCVVVSSSSKAHV